MSPHERLITNAQAAENAAAPRLHIPGLFREELQAWLVGRGEAKYRAQQILDWVYAKGAETFQQMTNLSKPLRAKLAEHADAYRSRIAAERVSADGTRKLLLRWPDGATVETVWIPEEGRNTACLSSQVGCPVGCAFCASGQGGAVRNLTAGEIVEQALRVRALVQSDPQAGPASEPDAPRSDTPPAPEPRAGSSADESGARLRNRRLSNIVLMGMGEPLANYEQVLRAIRIMNAPWGLNIGARKITLSTVGLPKQIRRLADEGLQLNLALSLHAPEQELRERLIPWGRVPVAELLDACSYYFERTGREVTLEYVLLADVNMEPRHALRLARIARRLRANVNLLRYNPVAGLPFSRPSAEAAYEFQARLRAEGVNAHLRMSRGRDIDAACGQLRRRAAEPGTTASDIVAD